MNSGENSDEKSSIVSVESASLQLVEKQYILSLSFGQDTTLFPLIKRPDITDDYFGNNWENEKGMCLAGPFTSILTGPISLFSSNV